MLGIKPRILSGLNMYSGPESCLLPCHPNSFNDTTIAPPIEWKALLEILFVFVCAGAKWTSKMEFQVPYYSVDVLCVIFLFCFFLCKQQCLLLLSSGPPFRVLPAISVARKPSTPKQTAGTQTAGASGASSVGPAFETAMVKRSRMLCWTR